VKRRWPRPAIDALQPKTVCASVDRKEEMAMIRRIQSTAQLLKSGEWEDLWRASREHLHSESKAFGLRRDVSLPFPAPDATLPITVRPIRDGDVATLLEAGREEMSGEAQRERLIRLRMIEAKLPTCYVAVTEHDEPCYMQWLIGPSDNDQIQEIFGDRFPRLAPDEMLLEGAFTLEQWRGKKIMAAAMARIAEHAVDHGARWVITFVGSGNIPSLKGCKRAGFEPYVERTGTWRLFRHRSAFAPLTEAEKSAAIA
jgi:GNAT superfamily N-acetyltransferase